MALNASLTPQQRFAAFRQQLEAALLEREEEIEALLLGMVAQEHVLLVGDPGTGKSMLCRYAALGIAGATRFEAQLNKFTTPEEIYGPVSVQSLKADSYRRLTTGYLPQANIAFIDEIFKGSSAINNTMLSVLNERTFLNGGVMEACPLRVLVAASNEWPVGEGYGEMAAHFDRFLLRRTVRRVTPGNRELLIFGARPAVSECISVADIDAACTQAAGLPWAKPAADALLEMIDQLHSQGIDPGDRRLVKAAKVAQAKAWLAGSLQVEIPHLEPLQFVLWDDPQEQPAKASEIICKIANPVGAEVNSVLAEAEELISTMPTDKADPKTYENINKLSECQKKLGKLMVTDASGRAKKAQDYLRERLVTIQKRMLGMAG